MTPLDQPLVGQGHLAKVNPATNIESINAAVEFPAQAVVLACPSFVSAKLLQPIDPELASELGAPDYASCATVNLVYRKKDLRRPLNRFGFFVPRTERLPLLAGSHVSVKFSDRYQPQTAAYLERLRRL